MVASVVHHDYLVADRSRPLLVDASNAGILISVVDGTGGLVHRGQPVTIDLHCSNPVRLDGCHELDPASRLAMGPVQKKQDISRADYNGAASAP